MNKKELYESIIKNVAKEVKNTLNESEFLFDNFENCRSIVLDYINSNPVNDIKLWLRSHDYSEMINAIREDGFSEDLLINVLSYVLDNAECFNSTNAIDMMTIGTMLFDGDVEYFVSRMRNNM